jgi:hypothetical protein
MLNKSLKAKRTTGRNGKPVITIEHISGDDAEFSTRDLVRLAALLLGIAEDVEYDRLRNNETREYTI